MAHLGQLTFSRTVDDDQDPDYVYYNGSIISNRTTVNGPDPQVRFQETRDVPIVNDASKYNFSIIRFTMNGPNKDLPLFIPVIRTGALNPTNDVNLTIYSVTIDMDVIYDDAGTPYSNSFSSTQPIIYSPETQDTSIAPVPSAQSIANGTQDLSTRYYWVYTYAHWLSLVNAALEAAKADIQTQVNAWWPTTGAPGPVPTVETQAPRIVYNPTTNLFTIYADRYGFGGSDRTSAGTLNDENARLFFNANMFGLFANFPNYYVNVSADKTNEILITNVAGLYQNIVDVASPPAPSAKSYWTITQDYESTSTLWSPIESIVFTSTLLPLVNEQTGDPVRFGQSIVGVTGNVQSAFQPIITDVALVNQNANDYREYIQYAPTAEYRLASFLRSRQPINNIDVQVFWKNRLDGLLYPVQMFNSSSVSLKIMFRRRGIFDYPHPAKQGVDV